MSKKAQSGKEVAVVILLIALFMVLYILLLPPEERESLLNTTSSSNGALAVKTILSESPGEIFPVKEAQISHDIQSMNIFFKLEPTTVNLASELSITKNIFSENSQIQTFNLESLTNLKDIILFFKVKDESGDLEIKLNDNLIFSGEIKKGEIKSISLSINQLKKENILDLRVSSPGIAFWRTNEYILEDIKLKETFERINPREERVFTLPSSELSNIKKSTLTYLNYCNSLDGDNTRLKIYINDDQTFSGIVNCASGSSTLEIPIKSLKEDQNKLIFVIEKGDFTVTNIKILNNLKEKSYTSYNFDIAPADYDSIYNGENNLILKLTFPETGSKRAKILVNDKEITMDTNKKIYSQEISGSVTSGTNLIKIIPSNTFIVDNLKVTLE